MATILITGGAGFIGCELSHLLINAGHEVEVIDLLHPQVHATRERPPRLNNAARLVVADVTESDAFDVAVGSPPDVVIHLAAETGTGQSLSEATRHGLVNVVGTTRLLDFLYRTQPRPAHLILASSRAVYGEGAWAVDGQVYVVGARKRAELDAERWDPIPGAVSVPSVAGSTEPRPTSIYGATKLAQESILLSWCTALEVPATVLRLQNVYGPGQSLTNSYTGVIALFARLALAGSEIEVYEDGQITRDFVHVSDVASALASAVDRVPIDTRLLDIGSGNPTTIGRVANQIAALAESPTPRISGAYRLGDVRAASCSIEQAREVLGYHPARGVEEGLSELLDWVATT